MSKRAKVTVKSIVEDIKKSPFLNLETKYYLGKIAYHTPYFLPTNFHPTIISFRKLTLRAEEDYQKIIKDMPWLKERKKFINLPMVRRNKYFIFSLFGQYFYVAFGFPIMYQECTLGWKDKYGSPRFEWEALTSLYFFKWQFVRLYLPPNKVKDIYKFFEMYLWWKHYSNEDIKKAEETWGWIDSDTKESTWDKNYLKNLDSN